MLRIRNAVINDSHFAAPKTMGKIILREQWAWNLLDILLLLLISAINLGLYDYAHVQRCKVTSDITRS